MEKRKDSPFQMFLLILVLINIVIIRDGFLLSSKLYLALLGTIPFTLYIVYEIWKRRRKSNFLQI